MLRLAIGLGALLVSGPLAGEVRESAENGFVLRHGIDVPSSPAETWQRLVTPKEWWNPEQSYSRDSANFTLDARAGGCFCEVLPSEISPKAAPRGSVEHMRVIFVEKPRALRMTGSLGPMQSGAATGTLTIFLRPLGSGTRVLWEYVYGGYMRGDPNATARALDAMLGSQLIRLGRSLGAGANGNAPADDPKDDPATQKDDEFARAMEDAVNPPNEDAPKIVPDPDGLGELPPTEPNDQGFIGR